MAVLTCSGGDSAIAADECVRLGLRLPLFAAEATARLRGLLPDAAMVGNPLDYTALICGDVERLRDIVAAVGDDPAIHRVLVLYGQAAHAGRAGSCVPVREGIRRGPAAGRGAGPCRLDTPGAARRVRRAGLHGHSTSPPPEVEAATAEPTGPLAFAGEQSAGGHAAPEGGGGQERAARRSLAAAVTPR